MDVAADEGLLHGYSAIVMDIASAFADMAIDSAFLALSTA